MAWYELHIASDGAENGGWMVTSPDFEELATFGSTIEEACVMGRAAIEEAIAGRIADAEDVPPPRGDTSGKGYFVEVPALVLLKSALYMILRSRGMTRADLMRELNWQREAVDRLFKLDHNSRLDTLEAAFKALGIPLRFDVPFPVREAA